MAARICKVERAITGKAWDWCSYRSKWDRLSQLEVEVWGKPDDGDDAGSQARLEERLSKLERFAHRRLEEGSAR